MQRSAKRQNEQRESVGVVGVDPLRLEGLREAVEAAAKFTLIEMPVHDLLEDRLLSMALLDREASPFLLELLSAIRVSRPDLRVIVLGSDYDMTYIQRVIASGARGYLPHTCSAEEVRMALDMVRDGSLWAPRKVLARLIDAPAASSAPAPAAFPTYTRRETEVLQLLVAGRSNRDIAETLGLNEASIKAHVGRLFRKVGVNNRTALTMHAVRYDLLGNG